jgi:hypothetical protein
VAGRDDTIRPRRQSSISYLSPLHLKKGSYLITNREVGFLVFLSITKVHRFLVSKWCARGQWFSIFQIRFSLPRHRSRVHEARRRPRFLRLQREQGDQGDPIGRSFACWAIVYFWGVFWKLQKPNFLRHIPGEKCDVLIFTKIGLATFWAIFSKT